MDKLLDYKQYLMIQKKSLVYYNYMNVLCAYLQKHNLTFEQITKETLNNFFTENTYKENSINNFIKSGRDYGKFLEISEEQNEFYKIKLLKTERKIPKYLTEEDIAEAKKYLITYESNRLTSTKVVALLDFLFYSGVRKNELLSLKREDFDFKNNTAKVYGKGKKERLIYFPDKTKKEVEVYFNTEVESINAFNITLGQMNYLVKTIGKYINKKVYTHLFRHSGAREMIRSGIPISVVSKILGHSSLATTMIYVDADEEMIKKIYKDKMN